MQAYLEDQLQLFRRLAYMHPLNCMEFISENKQTLHMSPSSMEYTSRLIVLEYTLKFSVQKPCSPFYM